VIGVPIGEFDKSIVDDPFEKYDMTFNAAVSTRVDSSRPECAKSGHSQMVQRTGQVGP
jgi:hypothetical protein